jgi:hypothetical protein
VVAVGLHSGEQATTSHATAEAPMWSPNKFGPVAQLGARLYGIEKVGGSNPFRSTRCVPRKNRCPEVAGKLAGTRQYEAAWRHAAHQVSGA